MKPFGSGWTTARSLLALAVVLCFGSGCASYTEETREIRSAYRADNYKDALKKLDASSLKDESKNRLLYRLEKAMILDRLGEREKARTLLLEADKIADDLYTTSISRTAASFVMNDAAQDYSGEDYEKVQIHAQLALSFIESKDLPNARVEAKKINNKLAELNKAYDEHKNKYGEDAFARYLSGIIYEAGGEIDDAIIDYQKAVDLYKSDFAPFVAGGVPDDLVKALYHLLDKRNRADRMTKLEKDYPKAITAAKAELKDDDYGEVVVFHELGHIAIKSTGEFFFGAGKQLVRFSFPVIKSNQQSYWGKSGVTEQQSGKFASADNVEELDAIASSNLEDRRLRLIAKQAARLLAKGQLTEQAYKNFGPIGGIAANVFSVVTETADTRSWTLLPEAYFISRLRLKPGAHTVKIETAGKTGRIESVTVKKGQLLLFRDAGG